MKVPVPKKFPDRGGSRRADVQPITVMNFSIDEIHETDETAEEPHRMSNIRNIIGLIASILIQVLFPRP